MFSVNCLSNGYGYFRVYGFMESNIKIVVNTRRFSCEDFITMFNDVKMAYMNKNKLDSLRGFSVYVIIEEMKNGNLINCRIHVYDYIVAFID